MATMTPQETERFLQQRLIALLTTLKPDGSPHTTPVWYSYDGRQARIVVHKSTVKLHNIQRDPRVTLCIACHDRPYRYVTLEGPALVGDEGVEDLTRELAVRYLGERRGESYTREVLAAGGMTTITVKPSHVLAWVSELKD